MPGSKRPSTARAAKARKRTADTGEASILAVVGDVLRLAVPRWVEAWRPKKRIPLSTWSAKNARLADGARYRAFPFQDDMADAFTQAGVAQISCMKSSRVGWSQITQNAAGYCVEQDPLRLLIYQPTIDDAENYGKDDLGPVFDWPAIRRKVQFRPRDPRNQVRAKRFPGGWVQVKGANSPKEFRRVTADWVFLEEPDGYPPVAGREGDQVSLAFKRCLTSDRPLKVAGSSPTIKAASRIGNLFRAGTQERRYVPCPHCGTMQVLVFGDGTGPGIRWEPRDAPTRAWYRCAGPKACDIEEHHKAWMDEHGEFRAEKPQNFPHRSFHIWAAYSQFPGAAWLEIAREFVEVREDPNRLMVFVNQVLGEEWEVKGEAPAWRRLYDRREAYRVGTVPMGGLVLTAGIDVQKDRVEIFVWAWGAGLECWLVDHLVVSGNPYRKETWTAVTEAVQRTWDHEGGGTLSLLRVGVDTGYATLEAETWARGHRGLVIPVKGASSFAAPAFSWSGAREAAAKSGTRRRGLRLGMIGGHVLTLQLYGLLHLDGPTEAERAAGKGFPPGYVHLSQVASEEFCKQLVGDQWVEKTGEWKKVHADEALDGWKYARAVLTPLGLDRWKASAWADLAQQLGAARAQSGGAAPAEPAQAAAPAVAAPLARPASAPRVIRSSFVGRVRR